MNISQKDSVAIKLAFVTATVGFLFGGVFLINYQSSLGWYPIVAAIFNIFGVFLIKIKSSIVGRLCIGLVPIVFNSIFHASMVGDNDAIIAPLYLSQFGMLLILVTIFDFKDKFFLILSGLIGTILLGIQPALNQTILIQLDGLSIFSGTLIEVLSYAYALVMIVVPLILHHVESYNSEIKNDALVEELKQYQERLLNDNQNLYAEQLEMSMLNNILEQKIYQRAERLRVQNKLLAEHSYINSHLLRAPLCRLEGLLSLLKLSSDQCEKEELIHHMKESISEMNHITRRIAFLLEKNGIYRKYNLNFDELQAIIHDASKQIKTEEMSE
ncbi:hypothetical protein [Reichenbachiella versicolor]|uniref:hypothetical protein n=1 Tax=Reichenbachiella versicolor TaxID=1821036 RepID=UPI000D6DD60C|nr:hypothetical protein [Reichenbachiella versicolor]